MTSRILVADDSPTIQKIVALAFEDEDMEVKGVANGQEAWEMLEAFDPHIIMADVELPGLSGFDLSRKIKSSATHQKRWVILLSSDFEEFDEQAFETCAAEDHLSKPFKSEDIVSKVQRMLSGEGIPNTLDIADDEGGDKPSPAPLNLSTDDIEEGSDEALAAIDLSADDMDESDEEGVMGLSPDDLIDELLEENPVQQETPPVMELSAENLEPEEEPLAEPVSEEEPESEQNLEPETEMEEENDYSYLLTDDRITDFDESRMPLDGQTSPDPDPEPAPVENQAKEDDGVPTEETQQEEMNETSPDYILGEPRRDPDPAEDLEQAFQAVSETRQDTSPSPSKPEPVEESASTDATPDLIRESQAFLAEQSGSAPAAKTSSSPSPSAGFSEEHMTEAMIQHAARVLEAGLDRNLKRELSGISEQVNRAVRDVVQELAPDIIREVIRQEIQEIRKSQ